MSTSVAPLHAAPGPGRTTITRILERLAAQLAQAPARIRGVSRPTGGALRVWMLVVGLTAAAAYLYVNHVAGLQPLAAAPSIPWGILAALFFIAEVKVVHFHFRRDAHSLSLNEIPFVIGLFFTPPQWFLVALLVGSGTALAIHRRQSPMKLAFNLAQLWLAADIALVVLHGIAPVGGVFEVQDWLAPFLATLVNGLVGVFAITLAISLSEGRPQLDKLPTILRLSTIVTVTNTSVALVAITVLLRDPTAAGLLLIPVVAIFLAYRAYVTERQKHERLELLYESTRILQQTPELEAAVVGVLRHSQTMFRAEFAELVLRTRPDAEARRTTVGPDDRVDLSVPVTGEPDWADWTDAGAGEAAGPHGGRIVSFADDHPIETRPDGRVMRSAMIAPLRGEGRQFGTLMVANRLGDVTAFDAEDLRLFETMANHIAVALENGQLEQSLARLTELKEELRHQASHDPLTALGNRVLLIERIEERLADRSDDGLVPAVLFLDLDDFKIVNDSLGHAAGDALLSEVGERIRRCLRAEDVAARLGGDEFAVLMMDTPDLHLAQQVARRIKQALRTPFDLAAGQARIRVSVGIAAADAGTSTADELLRYADVAMYAAKARGKAQVVVFEPSMHAAVAERHVLGEELQRAVTRGEFAVHYQPIVDLRTHAVRSFEALVRWRHPERGLIHPSAFVALAEEIGIIVPLGRWVLHEACRQVQAWNDRRPGEPGRGVSVNLSARQLQQTTFVDDVVSALQKSGLPAELLLLEVTETVMLQDTRSTIQTLQSLRALGVRIAIDDFGTGYSSLSYLRRFPVDVLKIAREFTDTGETATDVTFSNAILAIGRALGLEVIAEGIEREDQLTRLESLGCELGQGYWFGRPVAASRLEAILDGAAAGAGHTARAAADPVRDLPKAAGA